MNTLDYIVFITELIAACSASIYFFFIRDKKLIPILILLWYTFLLEPIATYYNIATDKDNLVVYNIYDFISFSILFYTFYTHVINTIRRNIIVVFFTLYFIAEIINLIYVKFNIFENLVYAHTAGCVLISLSILYYGIDLLYIKNTKRLEKNPLVWVSVAYMIFYVSYPLIQLTRKFVGKDASDSFNETFRTLNFVLVVLMYIIIAVGFLWNKKRFKFSR